MNKGFIGYHCDIARGAYLKPEYFKKAIELAAESGFTHFLPYLENMIRLPSIEKACPECAYTPELWMEFERSGNESGIEVVPHFNVIGHSEKICQAYPELAGWQGEAELDVTGEAARDWTLRCLREFCDFSTARYFLIGGDEWQVPNHLLAQYDFRAAHAWAGQINRAIEFLVDNNRIPIVWHDMLMHYPEAIGLLSRKAVIAFWFYDEDSGYPVLNMFKKEGFQTVMASGIVNGDLSNRRIRAISCALNAAKEHNADGFLITNWEAHRWETIKTTIRLTGRLINKGTVPNAVADTFSLYESIKKLSPACALAEEWKERLKELLKDSDWNDFPECRTFLTSVLEGDNKRNLESYLQYHYAQGDLYSRIIIQDRQQGKSINISRKRRIPPSEFKIDIQRSPHAGVTLRLCNNGETFVIYPEYGASLQDWRKGDNVIIPHTFESFPNVNMALPGGYRSYSNVGGFRPIWALGTNHNPCILWNYPYAWTLLENTKRKIVIELKRDFYHVNIGYRITITNDISGFRCDAWAQNKIKSAYGTFSFNLPISVSEEEINDIVFCWTEDSKRQKLYFNRQHDSFFRIPSDREIEFIKDGLSLKITSDEGKTAGYFIDWSSTMITVDLHGKYTRLGEGEEVKTSWIFSAH